MNSKGQFFILTAVLVTTILFSVSHLIQTYSNFKVEETRASQTEFIFHVIQDKIESNIKARDDPDVPQIDERDFKTFLVEWADKRGIGVDLEPYKCVNLTISTYRYRLKKETCPD